MGIFNAAATVLTTYKVNVKPAKKGIKDLEGAQKEQAKSAIDGMEKQNEAIDSQLAMLGKATLAVGAVVAAYKVAQVGLEAYEKRSRLAASTVGVDLGGLQKATKGLVSETRLLEFASKAMNGTFKLSQAQMETALKGTLALRKEGNELGKTLDNVGKALQEGTSEPLKELGLNFKTTNDSIVGVDDVLKELARTAREKGGDLAIPGDEMTRSQIAMADSVDELKISLGGLAQSLGPVVSALAKVVGLLADAVNYAAGITTLSEDTQSKLNKELDRQVAAGSLSITQAQAQLQAQIRVISSIQQGAQAVGQIGSSIGRSLTPATSAANSNSERRGGSYTLGNSANIEGGLDIDPGGYTGANSQGHQNGRDGARTGRIAQEELRIASQGSKEAAEVARANIDMINASAAESVRLASQQEQSVLASIFGTPTEIDAQTQALAMMAQGFDGLANAFGAGVDALITGSESFASAFKNAIGESLRAMAVEMSINAIKHGAMALGNLALYNYDAAAKHGLAAAQYTAGALAAGVGARLMGVGSSGVGSGSGGGSTAGTAGVGSSSPANSNGQGNTQVIVLGDDYGTRSAREREALIRQTMRGAGITVNGDFVVNG